MKIVSSLAPQFIANAVVSDSRVLIGQTPFALLSLRHVEIGPQSFSVKVRTEVGRQVFPQRGRVDRKFRYAAVVYRRRVAVARRHVAEALARGGRRDQTFLLCLSPAEFPVQSWFLFYRPGGMRG